MLSVRDRDGRYIENRKFCVTKMKLNSGIEFYVLFDGRGKWWFR